MSGVRVLVGTRKGAFVLTADGKRDRWDVSGPHFAGWEVYHLKGSPADPDRIYASQSSGWFGQVIQRSNDGGKTWETVGNEFEYEGDAGTHQWYDGTQHPWEFNRVWHLEPSLNDPDTVYAGVEDAALFRSADGGRSRGRSCRGSGSTRRARPGRREQGACACTPSCSIARDPERMFVAISAAGAFRSEDAATTWRPINRGLTSQGIPDPDAEVGHCVHRIAMHPSRPDVLFMQKHWDVMRSDDGGGLVARGQRQPAHRFRLPHRRPRPRAGHHLRGADQERLRALPARRQAPGLPQPHGGNEWEPLTKGLPQRDCYVNVLRDAMAVDSLDDCGIYFGTTGGQVYVSADGGRQLGADRPRPAPPCSRSRSRRCA